jgi:hypothetical protein
MRRIFWQAGAAVMVLGCGGTSPGPQPSEPNRVEANLAHSNPVGNAFAVTDWNATAVQFLPPSTPVSTRILAMTHLAIYDSVMAISHEYEPYAVAVRAPEGTSAEAAVAAAAHKVLVNQLPTQTAGFDSAYSTSLSAIPDGVAKTDGIVLGEFVAEWILFLRSGDVLGPASYSQPQAPGVWQPSGDGYNSGVVATTWPSLRPFALRSANQFRAPPPPALSSSEYVANFNQTKSLGATHSTTRTADQTATALFWYENGQIHFNRLASDLSAARGFSISQNARLFALLNVAMADGSIAVFDTKYAYNFWRPIAAIRGAAADGNPATEADPLWDSLLPLVAPHPEYISQHAVISSAAATVLARFFGNHTTFTLSTGSGTANGVAPRTYLSFSDAAEENAASRVWLGWHFPISVHLGTAQGRQVAKFALRHSMRPRAGKRDDDRDLDDDGTDSDGLFDGTDQDRPLRSQP